LKTLSLKPYESKTRVVIVSDAHSMNPEASNALLKVLEEPPDQTVLILTTDQRFDILPTVLSRCQQIRFKPLSKATLKNLLVDKQNLAPNEANIIATLAGGSFTRAVELSRGDWLHKRNWVIDEMASLVSKPIGLLLAFAESLSKDKEGVSETLDVMSGWFRDVLVYKWSPQKIVNEDMIDKIRIVAGKCSTASLFSQITLIQNAQKDIRANANVRLTLESMVVGLARVAGPQPHQAEN
jgi:DNA polymerase-3 subunit delta'